MSMNRRQQQLQTLLGLRRHATQSAAKDLHQAREQFNANKIRHEQLLVYRKDYMHQLEQMGSDGCVVGQMRNRIEFITQLDGAMSQLSQQLALLAKQRARCEKMFYTAKADEDAVHKLIAKVAQADIKAQGAREQKEYDEHAQKQCYSRLPDSLS